jgi:hypothetical protein
MSETIPRLSAITENVSEQLNGVFTAEGIGELVAITSSEGLTLGRVGESEDSVTLGIELGCPCWLEVEKGWAKSVKKTADEVTTIVHPRMDADFNFIVVFRPMIFCESPNSVF